MIPKVVTITLTGSRGCGKTRARNIIEKALKERGIDVLDIRETNEGEYMVIDLSNYRDEPKEIPND